MFHIGKSIDTCFLVIDQDIKKLYTSDNAYNRLGYLFLLVHHQVVSNSRKKTSFER